MTDEKRSYTDKVDYKTALFLHVMEMSREAARDGYFEEYEDMVDSLVDYLWPYIELLHLEDNVESIESHGHGLDRDKEKEEWERAKRYRIRHKTRLCFRLMHRNKLLLRWVAEYDADLVPEELPLVV